MAIKFSETSIAFCFSNINFRLRWSSDTTAPPAPGTGAKGVIPGMPVNLSQEQIQETLVLQMRLQQVGGLVQTRSINALNVIKLLTLWSSARCLT